MIKKKIVIFKGIIDSLDAFAEELQAGFLEAGCEVLLVNVNDLRYFQDEYFRKIEEYVYDEQTIVIFMNNIGMLMEDGTGGNYWNQSGVKCFDILADPPFFYHNAIVSDIENVTFVCVDEEQSDYINRYYGEGSEYYKSTGRIRKSIYMPLAGVGDLQDEDAGIYKNYNDRSMDVVFTGNIREYTDIDTQTENFDESLMELWSVIYGYIMEDTSLTIERAIRKSMSLYSLDLSDEHVHQIMLLFKRMDSVIRARFREAVIMALADGGVCVDVYGDGWDNVKKKLNHPENLIVHGMVSYRESVRVMQDAKISINVMPWFKKGFHDRIATAMLNGCVSVTDTSSYIQNNYIDGKDIILYDLNNCEELVCKVKTLLKDTSKAVEIANAGKEKARKYDTWKQRAEEFLKMI